MSNIFVEQREGEYVVTQDERIIATGNTQRQAINRARSLRPDDRVLVKRVRDRKAGRHDKWRRAY